MNNTHNYPKRLLTYLLISKSISVCGQAFFICTRLNEEADRRTQLFPKPDIKHVCKNVKHGEFSHYFSILQNVIISFKNTLFVLTCSGFTLVLIYMT